MITKNYDTLPQCAKDIRINVFINEQGFKEEFDELDGISNHLVTFDGDKPCATVRFYLYMDQKEMIMAGINFHINLSAGGRCFYTCLDGIFQQIGKHKAL